MKIASITQILLAERRKPSVKTRLKKDKGLEIHSGTCIKVIVSAVTTCKTKIELNKIVPYIFHFNVNIPVQQFIRASR